MNFAELPFWYILFSSLALVFLSRRIFCIKDERHVMVFDKVTLAIMGMTMLLFVSWLTFVIFALVAIGSYFGMVWLSRHQNVNHSYYLLVLLPLLIAPIIYYKYSDFFVNQVAGLNYPFLHQIMIPVGISFYTFQAIGFVIDTLVFKQPIPKFLDYINFISFFPQVVAGPIERRGDLLPQVENFRYRWTKEGFNEGLSYIVAGLFFKCCLADTLAGFIDRSSVTNAYAIWMANLLFGLRIYYDFAGYSLVAIGLGRCMNMKLTLNFESPYCSTSIVEFWRRWHITLSQWFRDYVYVPMGGGRTKRWAFNISVVFIVSGIWHGAGWGFIIWGAVHALGLIINRLFRKRYPIPSVAAWGLTMFTAFFAWLCFYETKPKVLAAKLGALFNPNAYGLGSLRETMAQYMDRDGLTLTVFLLLAGVTLIIEWQSIKRKNDPYHYLRVPWVSTVLVILTILLSPVTNNAFIYFAF